MTSLFVKMAPHATMCSSMLRQIFRFSSYVSPKSYAPFSSRLLFSTATTAPPNEQEAESKEEKPAADPSLVACQEENRKLLEQIKTIDDKYKRSLAENENLRVRMQKQIEEARVFGIQKFCKDLLDVADVLSSALSSVPKEAITPDNPHLQSLYTGLDMTQAQLQTVFRRHGLTQLNPVGMKFDPNEHQAVFVHRDESKEPGTVAVVSKIGYKLKDRTIRPAMVGVVERT